MYLDPRLLALTEGVRLRILAATLVGLLAAVAGIARLAVAAVVIVEVILEGASTVLYQWNGRISVYTGLPSVIGWQWHQEQQRFGYRVDIAQRLFEVGKIYGETNTRQAIELLRKYRVRYVYVGQFERMLYSPEGLRKFVDGLDGNVETVYSHGDVVIYQVLPG